MDLEIGESIAVTTAIAHEHASLGYQDGRKGSGMFSPTHPLPHSINSVLTITTERRRSLCPPVQVPHFPLLQLVGFFKRHERLPQSLPPRIRKAQSSDRNLRQPTATPPPRNYRKLHQRRTTVNMCEEPAERGRPGKGGNVEEQHRGEEQEARWTTGEESKRER